MIIAEIGQNFLGSIPLAKYMIKLAKDNGADLVKFQLYDTDKLYKKDTELYKQAREAELSCDQAKGLFSYGNKVGIEVFFSVFDIERVEWCKQIDVRDYKIAYSQRNNKELINSLPMQVGIIISTDTPLVDWNRQYMYCVPKYPADIKDIDFKKMRQFVGFSDHTIGLDVAKIAMARGVKIIEKHFCINHSIGVDAPWSMNVSELRELKRWETTINQIS